jgi:hypothetical protein
MFFTKCGHSRNICTKYEAMSNKAERENYIVWKYTVGTGGSHDVCYDCWIKKRKENNTKEKHAHELGI